MRRRRSKFSGADHRDPCPWVSLLCVHPRVTYVPRVPYFTVMLRKKDSDRQNLDVIPSRRSVPVNSMVLPYGSRNHQRPAWDGEPHIEQSKMIDLALGAKDNEFPSDRESCDAASYCNQIQDKIHASLPSNSPKKKKGGEALQS